MFQSFSHVMMYVQDLDRALDFYKSALGFEENFVVPGRFASLRHSCGCRIDLHPTEAELKDVGFGPLPYFGTSDLEASLKKLAEKGVKVGKIQTEGGHRFASFWDSEGNTLGLDETGG